MLFFCLLTRCSTCPSLSPPWPAALVHAPSFPAFFLYAFVLCPSGSGFVESAFLYPLDLAGLEHMQSAFSFYRRHGMTSQCEYYSQLASIRRLVLTWFQIILVSLHLGQHERCDQFFPFVHKIQGNLNLSPIIHLYLVLEPFSTNPLLWYHYFSKQFFQVCCKVTWVDNVFRKANFFLCFF